MKMNVDKENVVRALSDKPLLATHQWCCAFGIHTWLPWSKPEKSHRGPWDYVEQWRGCGFCNRAQRRVLAKDPT